MNNPIIQHELIGTLRTKKAVIVQLAVAFSMAALVVLRWPTDARIDRSFSEAQQVLQLFGYGLLACVMLLAPIFPATSIVRERRSGTLGLLLNTPIKPISIYVGKIIGTMGFLLLLLALSTPAAMACYSMGGIEPSQLVDVYIILALTSLMYATLALLISSYASTADSALRITYFTVLTLGVIVLGPYTFLQGQSGVFATAADWMLCISPITAMMETLGQLSLLTGGRVEGIDILGRYYMLAGGCTVVFAIITMVRLNHRILDRGRSQGKVTDERSASVRIYRRFMYLYFFDPQRRTDLIGIDWFKLFISIIIGTIGLALAVVLFRMEMRLFGALAGLAGIFGFVACLYQLAMAEPVLVKEIRSRKFGRSNWMLRLVAFCLVTSLGLMLLTATQSAQGDYTTPGGVMVVMQLALIVLITPTLACGLFSSEVENGSWLLLQSTPLPVPRIVYGKLMSVVWTLALILAATVPGYAVLWYFNPDMGPRVIDVINTLVLTSVMALLLSAACSSMFTRTSTATATAYVLLVTMCAGTLVFWVLEGSPFPTDVVNDALSVNPVANALALIGMRGFHERFANPAVIDSYKIINWYIMGGLSFASLITIGYRTWQMSRPQ